MINKNQIKRNELGCRSSQKVPKFGLLWRSVMLLGKIQFSQFHRIKSRQLVITWKKSLSSIHITFLFVLRYILSCYGTLILQLLVTKQRKPLGLRQKLLKQCRLINSNYCLVKAHHVSGMSIITKRA